jgi:hypothetical protein
VVLRNGVLVISHAASPGTRHVDVTRSELANFVLGKQASVARSDVLTELDRVLDRSRMLPPAETAPSVIAPNGATKVNDGLEH